MKNDNESFGDTALDKPLRLFNLPVICCDDGMCPEDFTELVDKLAWCKSVGLDVSVIRLQPYSYNKFKFIGEML